MNLTFKTFNAQVLRRFSASNGANYEFIDTETQEKGTVPCWCLDNFVYFDSELLDDDGHLREGSEVQLREMDNGRIYPGNIYKKKVEVYAKGLEPKEKKTVLMSRESLYDGIELYVSSVPELGKLWNMFKEKCAGYSNEILVQGIRMRDEGEERQYQFLKSVLGINEISLPVQESESVEFKSSFLHPAASGRQHDRMVQYRILFSTIAAFANSHIDGSLFVGVDNQGKIVGIEEELGKETPFESRADFQVDFVNQLFMATQNRAFTSSVKINWLRTEDDKIFCRIDVPVWTKEPVFVSGIELYVREHANNRLLKYNDLVQYILENDKKAAAE